MPKRLYSPDQIAAALVDTHGNRRAAARLVGCEASTIRWYIARHPVVLEAYTRALAGRPPPVGDPRRFDPEQVIDALRRASGNQERAARLLGCGVSTIARYRARFPAVAEAYRTLSPRRPGRRLDPDEVAAALEHAYGEQRKAARLLDCSENTIVRYRVRYPGVQDAYERGWRARGGGLDEAGHRLHFRPEIVAAAVLEARGIKADACRLLGCDWKTLTTYAEHYPAVRAAFGQARENLLDDVETALADAVDDGEWKAVRFVLSHLGKERGYDRNRPLEFEAQPSTMPRNFPSLVRRVYARLEAEEAQEKDGG